MKHSLTLGIALIGALPVIKAQTFQKTSVITTAVPSLQVPVDARAGGMGEAGIAISADPNSVFTNRAKTAFATNEKDSLKGGIAINYTPWMHDVASGMYLASVGGYVGIGENQAVSASVRYFNLGNYELRDGNGTLLQSSRPNDLLFDVGYARALNSFLSLSVALRYIRSTLASGTVGETSYKTGQAVCGDISLFYKGTKANGNGLNAGLVLSNLGSRISYTSNAQKELLPATIGAGIAYNWQPDPDNHITIVGDVNKLMVPKYDSTIGGTGYGKSVFNSYGKSFSNDAYRFSVGAEYTWRRMFSVRAGYQFENQSQGGRKGFTVGVGANYKVATFNIAFFGPSGSGTTRNPLSNSLRFSLLFDFF